MSDLRVALVHERFTEFAGSEQVVAQLARIWPDAPVLAPIALPERMPPGLSERARGTRLSRLVRSSGGYAHLLPLLPLAMRHLPVGEPDVVVASHHAFADQIVHATDAPVVAYVHSPARWVYDPSMRAGEMGGAAGGAALGAFAAMYRPADRKAAARLHSVVANSSAVADRVERWWSRQAEVVHPPVDTDFYHPDPAVEREDFFLLAGRLVPYKQPMLAVRAAARAGVRLVVAGDGRQRAECERVDGPDTTFLGRVSDEEMRSLFRRCRALLMPGVEDFGIVPVEAQACGSPVIATASGGALDSVVAGTGSLVPLPEAGLQSDDAVAGWADVLSGFDPTGFVPSAIRTHAEQFSREVFRQRMRAVVEAAAGRSPAV